VSKRTVVASAVSALLLAGSPTAFADVAPRHVHRHAVRPRTALAQPVVAVQRPLVIQAITPIPHRAYEIVGLTRNPEACAVYGCIGNN
jgi:hypothetical protein